MQQIDAILQVPNLSTFFNSIVQFFASSRVSTPQPAPFISNIDWSDSDSDSKQSYNGNEKKHVSGGYNEAFIVQHWAGYRG